MDSGKLDILNERSKTRLKKEIRKRIQTTMIGALSSIEKFMGSLWDWEQNTDPNYIPTKEQIRAKEIFEEMRTEILDKGNNQIRNAESEIDTYDVIWNKYHINLPIKKF